MELKRMSEIFAITPDPKSQEREEQCPGYYSHWCPFKIAFYHLGLQDTVVLIHGPQGCMGNEKIFLSTYVSQYHGSPYVFSPSTDMNTSDTILGAGDKLKNAILEVERIYKPKILFVMITCCAGVLKEPVDDIVKELESEIKSKIIVIKAEGFTHYAVGNINIHVSQKLCELFEEPKKKIPKSVNILGITKEVHHPGNFPEDSHEFERLLNKIGIKVNSVLVQAASLEDYKRAPEAEFNAINCPQWGLPMAKDMEERFGIPHGMGFNPLGVTAISKWLREIGEFFGIEKETEKLIEEEYTEIRDVWEEVNRICTGKYALLDGGDPMSSVGRNIAWGRLCADIGLEPIIFNIPQIEVKGKFHHVAFSLEYGFDPYMVHADYSYHRRYTPMQVVKGLGIDINDVYLYLGDVFPRALSNWDTPIFDPSNVPRVITSTHCNKNRMSPGRRVGFRGAERFARDVINAVQMAKRKNRPTLYGRLGAI